MQNAIPGADVLQIARFDDAAVAHRILVLQLALNDVAEDFRIAMRMSPKPRPASTTSSLTHSQRAKTHVIGVKIAAKGKSVPAMQPAQFRGATHRRRSFQQPSVLSSLFHLMLSFSCTQNRATRTAGLMLYSLVATAFQLYLRPMELRHLRYFVTVAEELNVSRASARLRISQPAVSRQLRDLEEELGVELFERDKSKLKLTNAGEAFLAHARDVLRRSNEAARKWRRFDRKRSAL